MTELTGDVYLVMLIHTHDDMPLRFFSDHKQAEQYAAIVDPTPTEEILELYSTEGNTPLGVDIIEFSNGIPVRRVYWRAFD